MPGIEIQLGIGVGEQMSVRGSMRANPFEGGDLASAVFAGLGSSFGLKDCRDVNLQAESQAKDQAHRTDHRPSHDSLVSFAMVEACAKETGEVLELCDKSS